MSTKNLLTNPDFSFWTPSGLDILASKGNSLALTSGWSFDLSSDGGHPNVVASQKAFVIGTLREADYPSYFVAVVPDGVGSGLAASSYARLVQKIPGNRDGSARSAVFSFWAQAVIPHRALVVHVTRNYGTGGSPSAEELLSEHRFHLGTAWQRLVVPFDFPDLLQRSFGSNGDDHLRVSIYFEAGTDVASSGLVPWLGEVDIAAAQVEYADSMRPTEFDSVGSGHGSYFELPPAYYLQIPALADIKEITATPENPPAGVVRFFARDNGFGKAQLCALFPTGAVVELATES